MGSPTQETHIPSDVFPYPRNIYPYSSDMCSPTQEIHIPSEMGFPYPGRHITINTRMCSREGEHISLGIYVFRVGEHISLGIYVSQVGEHISLGIYVSQVGEHISLGIYVSRVGICVS